VWIVDETMVQITPYCTMTVWIVDETMVQITEAVEE
jgi:hypothetical protein